MRASAQPKVRPVILVETATDRDAQEVVDLYRRVLAEGKWFITRVDEFKVGAVAVALVTLDHHQHILAAQLGPAAVHERVERTVRCAP